MRQKLGQHFLKDKKVLKNIAKAVLIKPEEKIIEIGGGHGELTSELVSVMSSAKGASLLVVEKDPRLATKLRSSFKDVNPQIEIVEGDIRSIILPLVSAGEDKYKLVGNLPYYLTGELLEIIRLLPIKPEISVFMVQKEVAERMGAEPPKMNRMAAAIQYWANVEVLFSVPAKAFQPPPAVNSAVVRLTTKKEASTIEEDQYFKTIKILFKQPRKTILNNIATSIGKENAKKAILLSGLKPKARPQNISIKELSTLAKNISLF